MPLSGLTIRSKDELAQGDRSLLPEEEVIAVIEKYDYRPDEPSKFGDPRDVILFTLRPESFADGSELEDKDGKPVEDKLLFAFIEPERTGFGPAGPSRARKFFAAAMGVPVDGDIEIESWDDLIGRRLIVSVGFNGDKTKNATTDFRKAGRNSRKVAAAPAEPQSTVPAGEDDDPFA